MEKIIFDLTVASVSHNTTISRCFPTAFAQQGDHMTALWITSEDLRVRGGHRRAPDTHVLAAHSYDGTSGKVPR